jgi:hypothetical protein
LHVGWTDGSSVEQVAGANNDIHVVLTREAKDLNERLAVSGSASFGECWWRPLVWPVKLQIGKQKYA